METFDEKNRAFSSQSEMSQHFYLTFIFYENIPTSYLYKGLIVRLTIVQFHNFCSSQISKSPQSFCILLEIIGMYRTMKNYLKNFVILAVFGSRG